MFISGPIYESSFGEGDALYIGESPLAQVLETFHDKAVYVAYAFSNAPISPPQMRNIAIESAEGLVDAELQNAYSDITGYLWTDERGLIGSHDLLQIFGTEVGYGVYPGAKHSAPVRYGALLIQTTPLDLTDLPDDPGIGRLAYRPDSYEIEQTGERD